MNPYNDNLPYDYMMPYNGIVTPQPVTEGPAGGGGNFTRAGRRNENSAAVSAILKVAFDDDYE